MLAVVIDRIEGCSGSGVGIAAILTFAVQVADNYFTHELWGTFSAPNCNVLIFHEKVNVSQSYRNAIKFLLP